MRDIVAFALLAGLLTITPGLDTFLVLRSALRSGFRSGLLASLGITCGLVVWAITSAVGIAALIVSSQEAFNVLRVVGSLYLAILGLKALWQGLRGHVVTDEAGELGRSGADAFRVGLMNNLLNPKVGVFYLTIFPQFLPDAGNVALWTGALTTIHMVEGLLWLALVAGLASRFRSIVANRTMLRIMDIVSGIVFLLFGARVLRETR